MLLKKFVLFSMIFFLFGCASTTQWVNNVPIGNGKVVRYVVTDHYNVMGPSIVTTDRFNISDGNILAHDASTSSGAGSTILQILLPSALSTAAQIAAPTQVNVNSK